jgi:hypothetical protein
MCFDLYDTPSVIQKSASQNINLRDFSIFFLLLAFYLLVLVSYTKTSDLKIVASSYDLAVSVYFVMLAIALKIAFSFSQLNKKLAKISVQGLFFGMSEQWLLLSQEWLVLSLDIFGHIFFIKTLKNSQKKINRVKSFLIMVSSSALGLSSLSYFYPNEVSMIASFGFGFIGVFGMLIASILKPKQNKN